MKRLSALLFAAAASAILLSCSTEATHDGNVDIEINIKQMSAGFAEVEFQPGGSAWYCAVMPQARPNYDPLRARKQFMNYVLDALYKDYINWRFNLLVSQVPHIADFTSHSLQYGTTDKFFTDLTPDTDYWLLAFPVNPKTNTPEGKLFLNKVHTPSKSILDVHFSYRVYDDWDYIYPMDKNNTVVSNFPYVAFTMDSLQLRKDGYAKAADYFLEKYESVRENNNANVFYGTYAHWNNGEGDGTSETIFKKDHIYYTGIFVFDGPISSYQIYKFRWETDLDLLFYPEDELEEDW